jgi:hypothetical protein
VRKQQKATTEATVSAPTEDLQRRAGGSRARHAGHRRELQEHGKLRCSRKIFLSTARGLRSSSVAGHGGMQVRHGWAGGDERSGVTHGRQRSSCTAEDHRLEIKKKSTCCIRDQVRGKFETQRNCRTLWREGPRHPRAACAAFPSDSRAHTLVSAGYRCRLSPFF